MSCNTTSRLHQGLLLAAFTSLSLPAWADEPVQLGQIMLSSEREASSGLPLVVIDADDMRAWGTADLADVLALVTGTTPARGGDAGPAGLLPGLTGAREADDYLLVVDGIPLGGTTAPPFESVSLADVKQIVIRRGPDPVVFGSAAFAGAIYIYHYPAGEASQQADLSLGSHGSRSVDASVTLPSPGGLQHSLSVTASSQGYGDPRASVGRDQLLYRASAQAGSGVLSLDVSFLDLRQAPLSPTPVTEGGLDAGVAVDSNQNPAGAHLDEHRSQVNLDYSLPVTGGSWQSSAAFVHTDRSALQGFLTDAPDAAGDDAIGYSQGTRLNEAYLDSHWYRQWGTTFDISLGVNAMYGNGNAHSTSFDYRASSGGRAPMHSSDDDDGDDGSGIAAYSHDWRVFSGLYAQSHWRFAPDFNLALGLRENLTDERRLTADGDDSDEDDDPSLQTQRDTRLSESALLEWHAWEGAQGSVTPYVAYTNSFQPAQFDFSPDPDEAVLLQPETARSWQLGVRGIAEALEWELSAARVDFGDAVVTQAVGGLPVSRNGGSDRFEDVDLDLDYRLGRDWQLKFGYEYVDARYLDYNFVDDDGDNVQLAGRRLPLTPQSVMSMGLHYGQLSGFSAALSAEYRGARFLDPQNQVRAGAFTSYDCLFRYGFDRIAVYVRGENLTDRRDPVAASEIGDGQVYRMLGRFIQLGMSIAL